MSRIAVETAGLRAAGGSAERVGGDVQGLAAEVRAALSAVPGAAPPATSAAGSAFSSAVQAAAAALGDGIGRLGANAVTAAGVYEQVDQRVMPAGGPR